MSDKPLSGKNVAILVASGFNEPDITQASRTLIEAGATIKTISVESGFINSWKGNNWGLNFMVDAGINTVLAADFDMLFVPSGERSLAKLSVNPHTKRILRGFLDAHKPVSLQGDAVQLLSLTDHIDDYQTSSDENTIIDTHLLTGNGKDFVEKMISLFCGLENSDELMQDAA